MSQLRVGDISTVGGTSKIDVASMHTQGYYLRKVLVQVDTTARTSGTTWTLGPEFANITDFQANSLIKITYHVPARNESTSWGGLYVEPQVRFNSGTWQSLGSSGYDAVMHLNSSDISSYFQSILIDPGQSSNFSAQFRFYFKSYDGTVGWNEGLSHDINAVSGTATIMPGANGTQHYMHVIVEEIARFT